MKCHIAKTKNTDQRCIIVFMQIPGKEDHSLIVYSDSLPDRLGDEVKSLLNSEAGQNSEDFGSVLHRRVFSDSGKSILQVLHEYNYLVPVSIDTIVMLPDPNTPYPLRDVLTAMGRTIPTSGNTANDIAALYENVDANRLQTIPLEDATSGLQDLQPFQESDITSSLADPSETNHHLANQKAAAVSANINIARNLLIEASILEADVKDKRARAYAMAPELRPVENVAETKAPEVKPAPKPTLAKASVGSKDKIAPTSKPKGRPKKSSVV